MNVFERWQATQTSINDAVLPTWAEFRNAIEALLKSYNATDIGNQYPARVTSQNGHSVVIASGRGRNIGIRISAELKGTTIRCVSEEWSMQQGKPAKNEADSIITAVLALKADPEKMTTWLEEKADPGKRLTAFEAAEQVLSGALLRNAINSN